MRPRTLLILATIAVLFGGYLYFFERKLPTTDERVERDAKVLPIEADAVTGVRIERPDATVVLRRADTEPADDAAPIAGWTLVEPFVARADGTAVQTLVDQLAGLRKERTLEDFDRVAAGFETPRATVHMLIEGAADPLRLQVGPDVPGAASMIVAVAGNDDAFQVSNGWFDALQKPAGDWRDPQLFHAARDRIEHLQLPGDVALAAHDDGTFWLASPWVDRADNTLVDALLTALTELNAARFVDDLSTDDPMLGLVAPAATLAATLRGSDQPFRVQLGNATPTAGQQFAQVGEQVVVVADALAKALQPPADAWRDRSWTGWQVFDIEQATVTAGDTSMVLRRQDAEWLRDETPIDFATVSDLLYAVVGARGDAVLDLAAPDRPSQPWLSLVLQNREAEIQTLTLLPADNGDALAAADGREALVRLPSTAVETLRAKIEAVRQAPAAVDESPTDPSPEAD